MSKNDKTIMQKIAELEAAVAWFESDAFQIEESLERYTEAEKMAGDIQKELAEFRNEITVLTKKFDEK